MTTVKLGRFITSAMNGRDKLRSNKVIGIVARKQGKL